ncbi:MAG: Holliday junction branch migration protein RuvA [Inquilinus sp.]|nr:Holliday junction branch migration protein RuvA [Inquilinus sp.]
MIAKLTGTVDSVAADGCVVDVNGVGYLVFASRRTLERLGGAGQPAVLHIETQVREDHIHLFGFIDRAERDWFRLLTGVQGVGGRVALSVLGVLDPDRLAMAIAAQDKAPLTAADGVGPKLAGRIVSELKDRVPAFGVAPAPSDAIRVAAVAPDDAAAADAVSALVNLGYGRTDAVGAVAAVAQRLGAAAAVETLIPAALKELAR